MTGEKINDSDVDAQQLVPIGRTPSLYFLMNQKIREFLELDPIGNPNGELKVSLVFVEQKDGGKYIRLWNPHQQKRVTLLRERNELMKKFKRK